MRIAASATNSTERDRPRREFSGPPGHAHRPENLLRGRNDAGPGQARAGFTRVGAARQAGLRWLRVKDAPFLLPQVKLAARFKGRLKAWLKDEQPDRFVQVPARVWWVKWVADIQPVGSGAAALKYLAAYLCRPPLHEAQLESWDAQTVTFRYRDNAGAAKRGTVSGEEFVRRVLQHVLPKSFQRVRHYGWLGGAAWAKRARIAALLDWRAPALIPPAPVPPPVCPACGKAMIWISELGRKPP